MGKRTLVEVAAPGAFGAVQRKAADDSAAPIAGGRDGSDGVQRAAIQSLFGQSMVARSLLVQRHADDAAGGAHAAGTATEGAKPGAGQGAKAGGHGGGGLRVSQPGDAAEKEADRVADAVMQGGHTDPSKAKHGDHEKAPAEGSDEEAILMRGAMSHGGDAVVPQHAPPIAEAASAPAVQTKQHPQGCVCCAHLARSATDGAAHAGPSVEHAIADMKGGGQSLPSNVRESFETKFGHDFGAVRVHTDERAHGAARSLNAQAFAIGNDIAFAPGQYQPDTPAGQHLLAHELTHVVQQGGASPRGPSGPGPGPEMSKGVQRHVQRSFFGDVWNGIKKVGSAIGHAVSSAGSAIWSGIKWLGGKLGNLLRDGAMWMINLLRDLPERLGRLLVTLWEGLKGTVMFVPELIAQIAKHGFSGLGKWFADKLKAGAAWVGTAVLRVLDLVGLPEAGELLLHLFSSVRKLTAAEIGAAQSVLGGSGVRWGDVRVGTGEILNLIWKLNSGRAFTTWHTINAPPGTPLHTMVHELTHVYQYEHVGTLYMAQAIHAQVTRGAGAYAYGDLVAHKAAGKQYRDFNREEQAQIAEDYYQQRATLTGALLDAFNFYIGQLRAGSV